VPQLNRSRFVRPPGTANPLGMGLERLQGNALQPLAKINSIPGFGTTYIDPVIQAQLVERRRMLRPPGGLLRF
jgi:hypothetical protein